MPRDRPKPEPFEPSFLERSLNNYLIVGLVFIAVLIAGFIVYRVREPSLRSDAAAAQKTDYTTIGKKLFATTCAECHGDNATGGGSAPTLNSKEFLSSTSDNQIHALVSGGISGTDMAAWSLDFGGTLTDEQVRQVVTYLRSLEPNAPSIPDWRTGATAPAVEQQARSTKTTVKLTEYAMTPHPAAVEAGNVTIKAVNVGVITHELVLVRAPSAASLPLVTAPGGERAVGAVDEEAIAKTDTIGETGDVKPGKTVTKTFPLTPGTYVMFCNIDDKNADGTVTNHFVHGMTAVLTVK
jgi:mono/diheme cytochrome c family protein